MVTACGYTFGGVWFLFFFCSTILAWVSVVSVLVFFGIFPWKTSVSFLNVLSFLCLRVRTGWLILDFSGR